MGKDKFKKRKERKRLIRAELLRRDIKVRKIADDLGYTVQAVYKGMTSSPKVMAALIEAGVPERMFKHAPSPQPGGGRDARPTGERDKDHRQEACATEGA